MIILEIYVWYILSPYSEGITHGTCWRDYKEGGQVKVWT